MADLFSMFNEADALESKLSVPQAVLPVQFYGARRGTSEIEPMRRLMVAMLVDAVRCFQTKFDRRQPGRRQEFAEVQSWIFSDADDGPFSFRGLCEALEIDHQAVRRGLVRWAAERRSGGKPPMIRRKVTPVRRISA
jgi:hypothetical protein